MTKENANGQAGLGDAAGGVAPNGFGDSAAESDARDHHASSAGIIRQVSPFEAAVDNVFQHAVELLHKKHEAYGPTNIAAAPGGPLNGLRVRMHDKLARINHIIDHPGVDTNDESLRDSFLDMMNYAAIAQMVLDGDWPQT